MDFFHKGLDFEFYLKKIYFTPVDIDFTDSTDSTDRPEDRERYVCM